MPVPLELKPFFTGIVETSRKSEINWEANGGSDAYRVRFEDFAIGISQDQRTSTVRVQLLNDRGEPRRGEPDQYGRLEGAEGRPHAGPGDGGAR
jgi:hypothetical protein